jgi:hypothetical protein
MAEQESQRIERSVGVPAEATIVRGLLQQMANTGAWTGLTDAGPTAPTVVVRDAGAGSSQVHVQQDVPDGTAEQAGQELEEALAELERLVTRYTSEAS